ncbi:MAG: condensation domain-containing protein, partial [Acidobacteriota bacterium]
SAYLAHVIGERRITTLHFVPSMLQVFLAELRAASDRFTTRRHLRRVICSGEALPPELVERFFERLGGSLYNLYGPTEAAVDVTHWTCSPGGDRSTVPIGRPISNLRIHLLDRHLRPVPLGVAGELHIGGAGLGRGYWRRAALTAENFIPDPYPGRRVTGARLYKTGDLARHQRDGTIGFLGRIDHQVKIRGFRIELGEIEAALESHGSVRQAVVVARDQHSLVAYFTAASADGQGQPETPVLRSHLAGKLPEYMVPAAFVVLGELPLLPNGKVNRAALPAPEWGKGGEELVAPRTPLEEIVAGIWCEVLQLDQVGAIDSFFELGGHSLVATQVTSRLREALGVDLPLRRFFELPTVAAQSAAVEAARDAGRELASRPLEPTDRDGDLPLSFAQERLWFLVQLAPALSTAYNVPAAVRLRGPLDLTGLRASLSAVVGRHESLRTLFRRAEGRPVQVILSPRAFAELAPALPLVDLSALPEEEREPRAQRLAAAEARRPFDLAAGPLLRTTVLEMAPDERVLLLTLHHIISDGWSMGVLVRELVTFYRAFAPGEPSSEVPLSELPVQYADFARWQRRWLRGAVLERQLAFWRQQLAGVPVLELPTDRPRPAVPSLHGATVPVVLPAALSQTMHQLARRQGSTPFMVLLAAFAALLSRTTGQRDIALGSPIANRNRLEIEGLIGFFVNTLVLRLDLATDPSFRQLLSHARQVTLGAYDYQDLPFEKLVEELRPERDLSTTPLFQVLLALQNLPGEALELPELSLESAPVTAGSAKFDLTLLLTETEHGLRGVVEYRRELFDSTTLRRLARHLGNLLAAAVADPERRIADLPLLDRAAHTQLLAEWNATSARIPQACAHQLFEAQVERTPEAVAVVCGERRFTYRGLNQRANRLAHGLRRQGVAPEVVVGVLLERSPELVTAVLAVVKAGGAYLPLDPVQPPERLAFMIDDAEVPVLLTRRRLVDELPRDSSPAVIYLDDKTFAAGDEETSSWPPLRGNPAGDVSGANLAYVIYTSGSTGQPKGTELRHAGLVNLVTWHQEIYRVVPSDKATLLASPGFDASVWELWPNLTAGAALHIPDGGTVASPRRLLAWLAEQ